MEQPRCTRGEGGALSLDLGASEPLGNGAPLPGSLEGLLQLAQAEQANRANLVHLTNPNFVSGLNRKLRCALQIFPGDLDGPFADRVLGLAGHCQGEEGRIRRELGVTHCLFGRPGGHLPEWSLKPTR
jgi:hypothetical protein